MPHPLVVKGRLLHGDGGIRRGAVAVDPQTGTILAVDTDLDGDDVIDHGESLVLPGGVDIHVHFRDPGHPAKEDFASGTLSALHGGVTTVGDMPNTDPATTSLAAYEGKRALVGPKAHVDWFLYGGVTRPGETLRGLAPHVPALKIYLGESTGCVTLEDAAMLPAVLSDLHESGFTGVVAFHAEAAKVLHEAGAAHREDEGLPGHEARRPVAAEEMAFDQIRDAVSAHSKRHGPLPFRLHIAHASSARLHQRCLDARLSHGVTPNHLLLHHGLPLGARGRLNPPLRTAHDAHTLFAALAAQRVPIIESDHAPHTTTEKDQPVISAPSGIPGVETMIPLLMAHVVAERLPLASVVDATSTHPAALIGLPKGRLAPGHHADLAVYDLSPERVAPIDQDRLHSRAGWSPFHGMPALFPTHVYLRGHIVLSDGQLHARPGTGREAIPGPVPAPTPTPTSHTEGE